MSNVVNEKSPLFLTIVFKDENDAPVTPVSADWRLDDREDDTEIVGWTSLGATASTMSHVIEAQYNAISNETKTQERRTFTVRMDVGLSTEAHQWLHYEVLNGFGPTGPV